MKLKLNRREFIAQAGAAAAIGALAPHACSAAGATNAGKGVAIFRDPYYAITPNQPTTRWAADQLLTALVGRGFDARIVTSADAVRSDDLCVILSDHEFPPGFSDGLPWPRQFVSEAVEALAIAPGRVDLNAYRFSPTRTPIALLRPDPNADYREALLVQGRDSRGLSYALTELADAVALAPDPAAALAVLRPAAAITERPANPIRGVIRVFASSVEDKGWFNDRGFWRDYLSMLAAHRFNRFNLSLGLGYDGGYEGGFGLRDGYLHFAYPFLVKVPGYDVRATNLPDAERDANLAMLRFISDEAAARGLEFFLGLWTHSFEWPNSPNANHLITGLTAQTQAPYSRDAVALILKECPNISGVTFRTHGESGVPEGNYDFWKTIFSGLNQTGRPVALDLHAKGIDQKMVDTALSTGLPVTVVPKFSAEHMGLPYHQADIRPTEIPTGQPGQRLYTLSEGSRSFTRYGYADLLNVERKFGVYHRIWPGTQRLLLWGDPVFAAAYSRAGTFGGSLGHEIFDPLSFKGRKGSGLPGGRDGYADASLRASAVPNHDYEKYAYGYRLWGRMLYNPDTKPEIWQRQLRQDYGATLAPVVEQSLGSASRILPLVTSAHLVSASNNMYWPELYSNIPIASAPNNGPFTDTSTPKNFGGVSPLDPQLFYRVNDYADDLLKGTVSAKYSPIEVAQWLEGLAHEAERHLTAQNDTALLRMPAPLRTVTDINSLTGLGRFFAHKFRAGVLFALFERTGQTAAREATVRSYRDARYEWFKVSRITKDIYVADLAWGDRPYQHGNWQSRLAEIDEDIAAVERAAPSAQPAMVGFDPVKLATLIATMTAPAPERPTPGVTHTPSSLFVRRAPLTLTVKPVEVLSGRAQQPPPREVLLHYRHANHAERWVGPVPMTPAPGGGWTATIPADYTAAPYPLTYYFEPVHADGRRTIYPGLGPDLAQQPYFVLMPA
jgi:hypothetical protein